MKAREADILWDEIENEVVILDLRSSSYLRTNSTGARLWSALQKNCQLEDLVDLLTERFKITSDVAKADVEAFIDSAKEAGLIEL